MVNTDKLKEIHLEFISWLNSQSNKDEMQSYITYVEESLDSFDHYSEHGNIEMLFAQIPRALSRYLDEFTYNTEFHHGARFYFDRMNEEVSKLRNQ